MHLPKEKAAPERRRHLRSVTTTYMPDHDVVAAPFADGHIATVVSASISPIVVPIKIATFALTPAVGPDTDVELSECDRRFGRDSIRTQRSDGGVPCPPRPCLFHATCTPKVILLGHGEFDVLIRSLELAVMLQKTPETAW